MIINQNAAQNISVPHTYNDLLILSQFESIAFILPDNAFDDQDDIENENTWLTKIKNEKLFIIHNVYEVQPVHKEVEYQESLQKFQYPKNKGKHRYNILFNKDFEQYKKYINFNFKDAKVIFYSAGNILAYKEGDKYDGFDVNIFFEPVKFGTVNPRSRTVLRLELEDPNDLFNVEVLPIPWNFPDLTNNEVKIENIHLIGNDQQTIYFDVKSVQYPTHPTFGLTADDITINDNGSSVNITGLTRENGKYKMTLDGNASDGGLTIDAKYYFTTKEYEYNFIGTIAVTLSNIATNGRYEINVTVKRIDNDAAVTTLVLDDFYVDGLLLDSATHQGLGVYKIVVTNTEQFPNNKLQNNGTISVVDHIYQGSNSYAYTKLAYTIAIEALMHYLNEDFIDVKLLDEDSNRVLWNDDRFDISNLDVNDELPGNDIEGTVLFQMLAQLVGSNGLSDGDIISFNSADAQANTNYQLLDVLFFDNFYSHKDNIYLFGINYGDGPLWLSSETVRITNLTTGTPFKMVGEKWRLDGGNVDLSVDRYLKIRLPSIVPFTSDDSYRVTIDIDSISVGGGYFGVHYGSQGTEITTSGEKVINFTPESAGNDGVYIWFWRGVDVVINSIKLEIL